MCQDTLQQDVSGDAIDAIVAQWQRERPDLDASAKEVCGRIMRLASLFGQAYSTAFAALGLNDGDYGVLVALRRAGAPNELTPSELARQRMMTSGGMTAAIDRLERQALVARSPNPNDRRGTLIALTAHGREVVDRAMEVHSQAEQQLVASLDERERTQLRTLLRTLLLSVDQPRT